MEMAVSLSRVSFQYKDTPSPALADISLSLSPGECALIQGPSASGKTTLCHCLNGLIPQAMEGRLTGEITVAGKDVSCFRTQTLARDIGVVMQDPETQIVGRTVFQDLAFGPANLGVSAREIRQRIPQVLDQVGLKGYENRETSELSGGEKQRLAIAGILAMQPAVLVLDEPASELDPRGRADLYASLDRLRKSKGITLIMVEQKIHDILPMIDQVLILEKGRMASQGPPASSTAIPQIPTPGPGSGHPARPPHTPALLDIRHLDFGYDQSALALKNINLTIYKDEFIAIMGHNGAGKTTLIKHLNGLIPSDRVRLKDKKITSLSVRERAGSMGFVFQNPDHQIFENSVEKEIGFGLKQMKLSPDRIQSRVAEVLVQTGLEPFAQVHPFTLPRGMRQLIAVASAGTLSPDILVVDEPFTGLDATGSRQVMDLIIGLHNNGTAIVLITHDLVLAARHAHRLIIMAQGEILADSPMTTALKNRETLVRAGLLPPETGAQHD